jgi:hypothetical protein
MFRLYHKKVTHLLNHTSHLTISYLTLFYLFSYCLCALLPHTGEIELEALGALCQTAVSRETAYALIYQLCKSDQSNLGKCSACLTLYRTAAHTV